MIKRAVATIISAICFGFLAIFTKHAYNPNISSSDMLFFRFALGCLFFTMYFIVKYYNHFIIKKMNLLKAFITGLFLYFNHTNLFCLKVYASRLSSIKSIITVLVSAKLKSEKVNLIKIMKMIFIVISILPPQLKKVRFILL